MTEFRPGSFQMIPPVIKNLIIVNALVYLAQNVFEHSPTISIENLFALHDVRSYFFKPHQLVTYMFLHSTESFSHILFNMFALWMFGAILENLWGPKRFLIFYFACGLGSAVLHLFVLHSQLTPYWDLIHQMPGHEGLSEIMNPDSPVNTATLGASGAVFGCLAAFGYLFPNSLIYLYFFVPIKAKWFVLAYAGMELFLGIRNTAGDTTAHWAHLGGAAVGILLVIYWQKTDKKHFY
jgi:membrane associated rhomboid family serine protease